MKKNNVITLPKITDQNLLAKFYSMADSFVICSKRENFPTTCLEAQCCGTPVCGFDTGGTKETSVDKSDLSKLFVPYGDLDSLEKSVMFTLGKNNSDLSKKAANAYSKEVMFENYCRLFDSNGGKKRIALIDVNCKGSSTGKIVYDLQQSLIKDGREAAVFYGRGSRIEENGICKFGIDFETYIHAALARITGYNGCFSPLSTRRLIQMLDRFNPDLIHLHELHAYFLNIKPLIEYIKKKRIPVVWTFHCEYMYTGKCGHAKDCKGFLYNCGDCPAIHDYPKSLLFDKTQKMLTMKKKILSDLDFAIITPSQWLADRVKLSFLKEKPICVIYNGINTEIFHPVKDDNLRMKLGIPSENKIVLAVAPNIMSEMKGGKWVIELANRMKMNKITFILIGVSNEKRTQSLKQVFS